MQRERITEVIMQSVAAVNSARADGQRIELTPTAILFGPSSPLDSLGLVSLLIDIEEAFQREGHAIVLSDERALSQRRSPFRDVPSLTDYIERLVSERRP